MSSQVSPKSPISYCKSELAEVYSQAAACGTKLLESYPEEPRLVTLKEWETSLFGDSEWVDSLSGPHITNKKIRKIVERAVQWLKCRAQGTPLKLQFSNITFKNMEYSTEQMKKVVHRCIQKVIKDTDQLLRVQVKEKLKEYEAWKESRYPGKSREGYVKDMYVLKDRLYRTSTTNIKALMDNFTACEKSSENWILNQAKLWWSKAQANKPFSIEFTNISFENIDYSLERIRNATLPLQLVPE